MRAAVLEQPGLPVRVEDLVLDEPRAGAVRVRITASGVCHADLEDAFARMRRGESVRRVVTF